MYRDDSAEPVDRRYRPRRGMTERMPQRANTVSSRWKPEWGEEPGPYNKPECWCGHTWAQHSNSLRKDATGKPAPVKGPCKAAYGCCKTYDPRTYVSKERRTGMPEAEIEYCPRCDQNYQAWGHIPGCDMEFRDGWRFDGS